MSYGSSGAARFFGGSPIGVILRLLLLCVIVGLVLDQLDLDVFRLLDYAIDVVRDLIANSADLLRTLLRYLIIGAMVVIPIWLILRVLKIGSGRP
ncbi:hypothetical protein JOD31_001269 [Methylopila capsulata]|uniref:DUF6460 domain-containing protein n=1 Tax=Methylopila capsulata TaxID=61654 RepID=A0A9W6MQD7_9HYPH|nr:DUF6460 domain-containing protein [Methylopila capsulata]MBM7851044.1 hypothetical protein [Methylopila capsulata]GLK54102.1 hypothetical protein GCM10008170_01210 [Methylopila capsulata]